MEPEKGKFDREAEDESLNPKMTLSGGKSPNPYQEPLWPMRCAIAKQTHKPYASPDGDALKEST